MAYAVVRTDNLSGIIDGARLATVHFYDGNGKAAAIQNGNIITLNGIDERGVFKAIAPTANQGLGKLALVATPEIMSDRQYKNLDDFINAAGAEVRVYILHSGDVFSVTAEALDGTVGNTTVGVEVQAGTKLKVVTSATNAVADYLGSDVENGYTYYKFRVI